MFIAGVLVGPALAIALADFLVTPGRFPPRWVLLAVTILLLIFLLIPAFPAELKFGLLIGVPVGLLLIATPVQRARTGM